MASEPPISNEPGGFPLDPERPPRTVEEVVVRTLGMPRLTREDLEEMRGEDEPPVSDFQVVLDNLISDVKRYSVILACIAIAPETKRRINAESKDAAERVPVWLDAAVNGPPLMTPRLFMHGLAQMLGAQRGDFEQVIAEQVREPGPIEELLEDAPIPQAGERESDSELTDGVSAASGAHMRALVEIARDLDRRLRGPIDPN